MNYFAGYNKRKAHRLEDKVISTTSEMVNHVRLPKKVKQHPYNLRGY